MITWLNFLILHEAFDGPIRISIWRNAGFQACRAADFQVGIILPPANAFPAGKSFLQTVLPRET